MKVLACTIIAFCVLNLTSSSVANAAGVFKWVDDDGNVHYGDQADGQNSEQVKIQKSPPPSAKPVAVDNSKPTPNNGASEKADDKAAADPKEAEKKAAMQKEQCDKLRKTIDALQRGGRLYRQDKNGERSYLSDKDRLAEIEESKKNIAKNCN